MNRLEHLYRHPWTVRFLKRPVKRYLLPSLVDGGLVALAFSAALSVRFAGDVPAQYLHTFSRWAVLIALGFISANVAWQIYGRLWRYATFQDVMALVVASGFATALVAAADLLQRADQPLPLSQILLGGLFAFLLMLIIRSRHLFADRGRLGANAGSPVARGRVRVLIVGAGDHGQRLLRHFQDDPVQKTRYQVVGFVDDDQTKEGLRIHGLKVLGTRHRIAALVAQHAVDQIIIASPATFGDSFEELVSICQDAPAQIKVLPRFCDLLENSNPHVRVRDLTIEDVLDREPVQIDRATCHQALVGRVILVTGAGGSIGSELCRQLLSFEPECLLMVDNNETSLHDLHLELTESQRKGGSRTRLCPMLADVTDAHKMELIFREHMPQVIFHAAAYKHVPEMEVHVDEAVRVNVMGTVTLTEIADRSGAERFIFISSDKAVNPTSVMGASKRVGEMWLAARQQDAATQFASVRFGNVVGSRGSVVPLFSRQIERGGPVTVTDPRMTRYFMSIPEAASLIIQASTFEDRGAIYMLNMGRPVRIVELAHKMIRLKGLRPGQDIPIRFIGARPGEKLHEELAYPSERTHPTAHPKINCLENHLGMDKETLLQHIALLAAASQSGPEMIVRLREGIVLMARGDVDAYLEALADIPLYAHRPQLATVQKTTAAQRPVLRTIPPVAAHPVDPASSN